MSILPILPSRYYKSDKDVENDLELQNFMNEVSADGTGEDGGNGNVRIACLVSVKFFAL